MKEVENLCVVTIEECAELQQALSKSLRFGFHNYNPETPEKDNAIDILNEYYQLIGIMEMLIDSGEIGHFKAEDIEYVKQSKRCKVSDYKELSKAIGTVGKDRTSISEQVKELRKYSKLCLQYCNEKRAKELLSEAADTIESLSARLADMERSAEDCGGGWIPCKNRLPETSEYMDFAPNPYMKRLEIAYMTDTVGYAIGYYDGYKWIDKRNREIDNVIAWKPFLKLPDTIERELE